MKCGPLAVEKHQRATPVSDPLKMAFDLGLMTYKAANKAGDKEDDSGCEEDAVWDDQLVEQGGVSLSSKQANPCKLIALNLVESS